MLGISCNTGTAENKAASSAGDTAARMADPKMNEPAKVESGKNEPVTDTLFGNSKFKSILKVTVLPTADGGALDDSEVKAFKYPDYIATDSNIKWAGKIAALGAAYEVWLAPAGWTGKGDAGADRGKRIQLFPPGGESLNGAYISYYEEPACVGCILSSAGLYFAAARKVYNENFNDDGTNPIKIPDGLKVKRASSNIVTYMLPAKNGLTTHGVAIYRGEEDYFEATFVFPEDQSALSDFLLNYYLSVVKASQ